MDELQNIENISFAHREMLDYDLNKCILFIYWTKLGFHTIKSYDWNGIALIFSLTA